MTLLKYIPLLLVPLAILGCSREFTSQPLANQPPETFLFLNPDSTLRRTTSVQHVHWWGADPDGFVVGFLFSFDSVSWSFTARNDSSFSLKISSTDTAYSFWVAACDNGGNGRYDAVTPYGREPFTDLNANGVHDANEPFVDIGRVDPTPASVGFPIQNTPPEVSFVFQSDVPETTYTVATFQWVGKDFDGDETIASYYYALDDTSGPNAWRKLPGSFRNVTLFRNRIITASDPSTFRNDSLTEGNHVFYLRAQDVAGTFSRVIRMPDTSKTWYVKVPRSDFLIVDDYATADASANFYSAMFDTVMGGRLQPKDIFDIKLGATSTKRGRYVPALINPTFSETLKLFKYIFWYSDNAPSLEIAQASLPAFKSAGGKALFTCGFPSVATGQGSVVEFAPIADVEPSTFATRLLAADTLLPEPGSGYPLLWRDNSTAQYLAPRGVIPTVSARVLYRTTSKYRTTADASGNPPIMGVKDADTPSFVLVALLLNRFGTPPDNVAALLRKVYAGEFGVQ